MRVRAGAYRVLGRNLRERDYLESLCVDGMVTSKWIFKSGMEVWTGLRWLRIRTSDGRLDMR